MSTIDASSGAASPALRGRPVRKFTMLSRTADNIFWLARYMERADFLARTMEATQRLAVLPAVYKENATEWESALETAGAAESYRAKYPSIEAAQVADFLTFDHENPSSICNCIERARTNARAVRTALTAEMWDAINGAWLELKRFETSRHAPDPERGEELTRFLEFVKQMSLVFDGCAYRTMLRDPSYWFSRLGLFIERADNTARILDVKYHVLLPATEAVGGSLDYFQWTAILRAVSALTAYRWVYREGIKPWLVADLLMLRPEMPRSLLFCYENIVRYLGLIAKAYGAEGPAQVQARHTMAALESSSIQDIFQRGLHEFITDFLDRNDRLGAAIGQQFLA